MKRKTGPCDSAWGERNILREKKVKEENNAKKGGGKTQSLLTDWECSCANARRTRKKFVENPHW